MLSILGLDAAWNRMTKRETEKKTKRYMLSVLDGTPSHHVWNFLRVLALTRSGLDDLFSSSKKSPETFRHIYRTLTLGGDLLIHPDSCRGELFANVPAIAPDVFSFLFLLKLLRFFAPCVHVEKCRCLKFLVFM